MTAKKDTSSPNNSAAVSGSDRRVVDRGMVLRRKAGGLYVAVRAVNANPWSKVQVRGIDGWRHRKSEWIPLAEFIVDNVEPEAPTDVQ